MKRVDEPVPDTKRAAEHAGLWKADNGQAPHYSRSVIALGWTCWACPLDECDWHHDVRVGDDGDPVVLEAMFRTHLTEHDVADFLRALVAARESNVAVRESNNRAWDVVQLHRLRACHRGENPYADPVAQMLSGAMAGAAEHEEVRAEVNRLGESLPGSRNSASVPYAERTTTGGGHERG